MRKHFKFTKTKLDGLFLIERRHIEDERGFFLESYSKQRYRNIGIKEDFLQDNHSRSKKNVLRGLHFQYKKPQGKFVSVSNEDRAVTQ